MSKYIGSENFLKSRENERLKYSSWSGLTAIEASELLFFASSTLKSRGHVHKARASTPHIRSSYLLRLKSIIPIRMEEQLHRLVQKTWSEHRSKSASKAMIMTISRQLQSNTHLKAASHSSVWYSWLRYTTQ